MLDGIITHQAPWKLSAADDTASRAQLAQVLYDTAEWIRHLTLNLYPFIPEAASKAWRQLGLGEFKDGKSEKWLPGEYLSLHQWGGLKPGTKIGQLGPIFPRADKDAIEKMQRLEEEKSQELEQQNSITPPPAPAEPTPEALAAVVPAAPAFSDNKITVDDFAKVELRVAQIKVAERVPKADKLLRLEVDLGYEQRQILAGIAEAYAPESLIGRKVVIVANLAPRKLRGLESNGMIVAASLGEAGKPVLAGFLEDVEIGARLK